MKKALLIFQYLILFVPFVASAQVINGIVKNESGSMQGVTISEKGLPKNATVTDANGRFKLALKSKTDIIVARYVGYTTREVKISGNSKYVEIIMQSNVQGLDGVVVVAYGTKSRVTNTGAVSTINADLIRDIPTSAVQNTLAGRVPGFFSQQRSGQPGKDASDFFIRGVSSLSGNNQPLIIVDDIQYTYDQLSQINVNEIESISILKDASTTAIYGIKGANGVLIVKTRRGVVGKPKVNVRIEGGMQTPVRAPQFLDAYQTALLRNEALSNDGLPAQFTQNDLNLFQNGTDPYGHPNVNWYKAIFKPHTYQTNTNVDISGGTPRTKYFLSAGSFWQNGAVRDFSTARSEVNSNYFYNRYNFRTNLDVEATKTLALRMDLTGRFGVINQPDANGNLMNEIYDYTKTSPYGAPFLNPNGSYSYNRYSSNALATINSRLATQGYDRSRRNDFNILIEANQKLNSITDGLSFKGRLSYASTSDIYRDLVRFDQPPRYLYDPIANTYTRPPGGAFVLSQFTLKAGTDQAYHDTNLQGMFNYDRTFGYNHVYSLLLFNQDSQLDPSSNQGLPTNYRGYSLRVGYEFNRKYLFDFNGAYNGTDRFAKHYGFFPAVSVGWNISRENFVKDNFDFFQLLKLRGSYGIVGSDAAGGGHYLYQQNYFRGDGYSFGQSAVGSTGIYEGALANSTVGWEKQKELDLGLDVNAFKDKLALTFDYFHNIRYNQLISRNSVSQILGVGLPQINLGRVQNDGFDGQLNYRPNIGRVQFDFGFVFSYAKNKILYFDEALPNYPYLRRTGQSLGQPYGYTWIGYYQNEADVANSPKPVTDQPIRPGDLKYKDLNGDGKIDQNDEGPIGKPNLQNLTLGLPIGIHYKGFDANILFQGSFNYSLILNSTAIEPFQSELQPIHELRWTPETANSAQFPRLTTLPNSVNSPSAYPSDFWLVNAQFIRLKTVELGYQLPQKMLPFKLNNIRVYLSAYNLITWTNYSLYQQDPEVGSNTAGDSYLNQRVVNLGVQVGF